MTRNERRKAAAARSLKKQSRLVARLVSEGLERNRKIIASNRHATPEPSIRSCMADLKSLSHRAYVCQNVKRMNMDGRDK